MVPITPYGGDAMGSTRSIMAPLVAIILGTFMVILDNTVVTVALPQLGRAFGTDLTLLQWVITGYFLAQAAVIPLAGWLSDRYGAKRIYLISLVLFTAGSALCGLAASGQLLVAMRVIQGLGGGMLMPIGMAVLYRLTPPGRLPGRVRELAADLPAQRADRRAGAGRRPARAARPAGRARRRRARQARD